MIGSSHQRHRKGLYKKGLNVILNLKYMIAVTMLIWKPTQQWSNGLNSIQRWQQRSVLAFNQLIESYWHADALPEWLYASHHLQRRAGRLECADWSSNKTLTSPVCSGMGFEGLDSFLKGARMTPKVVRVAGSKGKKHAISSTYCAWIQTPLDQLGWMKKKAALRTPFILRDFKRWISQFNQPSSFRTIPKKR